MFFSALNSALFQAFRVPIVLGQSSRIEQATSKVNFYLIVLTCTFLALAVIGLAARKFFNSPIESSDEDAVLNLSDLRRMHREGELTDDEYLAARAAALAESGVYVSSDASDNDAPEPADKTDQTPPANPISRPGVELGPELLDRPEQPPEPDSQPDNPD